MHSYIVELNFYQIFNSFGHNKKSVVHEGRLDGQVFEAEAVWSGATSFRKPWNGG